MNGGDVCSRVDFNMTTVCAQGQVNSPCQQVQRPVCYGAQPSCNYANQQCCVDVPRRVCQPVAQRIPTPRSVCRPSVDPPPPVRLSVCLPAGRYMFFCLSVCLSACLSVACHSACLLAVFMFVCLSEMSVCLRVVCLSICLPA